MRSPNIKFFLITCLLLLSTPAITAAQETVGSDQNPPGRTELRRAASKATQTSKTLTRAQTKEAERRLAEMGYWSGAVDGRFDPATRSALIAFQKWEGRPITGRLTLDELEAIRTSTPPQPKESGYAHIEVDVDRQVLLVVNDDGSVRVLPTSTGSGKEYLDEGQTSVAYTPRGRFLVYNKVNGWEQGEFTSAYYSNFISGSVAIHGYPTVPNEPASHGCIRIPIFAAREVSKLMPLGTIVLVYDKISFVSAKAWAENPQRKKAALYWSRVVDGE
jgi:peptidoglycan hydrolase-like protein with peptidoglycan-binding domain